MHERLRAHLTYANVVATLALFAALGGSSYAALKVSGKNVRDRSLTGREFKRSSIGGKPIKESRLGIVPRARNALQVNGVAAGELLVRCPEDTFPSGGTCIERTPRPPQPYGIAVVQCQSAGGDRTPGRRLPTQGELIAAYSRVDPALGGELTGHVYVRPDTRVEVLVIMSDTGTTNALVPNTFEGRRPFRCAVDPLN